MTPRHKISFNEERQSVLNQNRCLCLLMQIPIHCLMFQAHSQSSALAGSCECCQEMSSVQADHLCLPNTSMRVNFQKAFYSCSVFTGKDSQEKHWNITEEFALTWTSIDFNGVGPGINFATLAHLIKLIFFLIIIQLFHLGVDQKISQTKHGWV